MLFPSPMPREFIRTVGTQIRQITHHSRSPHFFSLERGETLKRVLTRPYDSFIEVSQSDNIETLLNSLFQDHPDIIISITTPTCYKNNTALCVSEMLSERFGLLEAKKFDVSTCLQEAIMNAIFHGNLGVSSKFNTVKDFEKRQAKIEELLEHNSYKNKRIYVSAWDGHKGLKVAVRDEGSGFTINNKSQNQVTPHGRGLMFIKTMSDDIWVGDDARTLFMNFHY